MVNGRLVLILDTFSDSFLHGSQGMTISCCQSDDNSFFPIWYFTNLFNYFMRDVSLCISQIISPPPLLLDKERRDTLAEENRSLTLKAVPVHRVVISEPENFSACGLESRTMCCKKTGTSPKGSSVFIKTVFESSFRLTYVLFVTT